MQKLLLIIFLGISLYAKQFTVASYNVENLFDLNHNKSDYKEYIPNTKSNWNKKTFEIKLNNLIKVLNDLDADIIALQEIESKELMKLLLKKTPKYKYYSFDKYENSSVGIGFLSKIKIVSNNSLNIRFSKKTYRPILETTFEIENIQFKIFNNHWPSKRVAESYRIKYAKNLFDRVNNLPRDYDYILLGDFNSNYNEFETIYKEPKLNNANGITGINQVLNTTIEKRFVSLNDMLERDERVHYNLWLDLDFNERFSNKYKGKNTTPDNIILSPALFDNKKISYLLDSFYVFKPEYLYKNKKILRWEIKNKTHKGDGFSDHLPIIAKFSTKKIERNPLKEYQNLEINKISQLYEKVKLQEKIELNDVIVIYKKGNNAIIKQKDDRAIYLYNNAKDLKEGFSYDLEVSKIKDYFGLKEIIEFKIKKYNGKYLDYESFYLSQEKIDIFNFKNQNEIIKNLKGYYKKGYLYLDKGKIRVYALKKENLPKENKNIVIPKAHLSYYKDQFQILLHEKID